MNPIVARILEQSKSSGISQKDLAARIGIRPQAITEWKIGTTSSYTKYLPKIAEALDVSVDYLLSGEKETPIVQNDGLSTEARKLLKEFERLNKAGKMFVLGAVHTARALQDQEEEKEHAGQEKH